MDWSFFISNSSCRIQLYIQPVDAVKNQQIFDQLEEKKSIVEDQLAFPLDWMPMKGSKACRISSSREANLFDERGWAETIEIMTERMIKLEKTFSPLLAEIMN